jgi:hypothetical protein
MQNTALWQWLAQKGGIVSISPDAEETDAIMVHLSTDFEPFRISDIMQAYELC